MARMKLRSFMRAMQLHVCALTFHACHRAHATATHAPRAHSLSPPRHACVPFHLSARSAEGPYAASQLLRAAPFNCCLDRWALQNHCASRQRSAASKSVHACRKEVVRLVAACLQRRINGRLYQRDGVQSSGPIQSGLIAYFETWLRHVPGSASQRHPPASPACDALSRGVTSRPSPPESPGAARRPLG